MAIGLSRMATIMLSLTLHGFLLTLGVLLIVASTIVVTAAGAVIAASGAGGGAPNTNGAAANIQQHINAANELLPRQSFVTTAPAMVTTTRFAGALKCPTVCTCGRDNGRLEVLCLRGNSYKSCFIDSTQRFTCRGKTV